jgi:hypothetical protein
MQVAQWPSQQQPAAAAHLYGHPQQGHDALVAALRQQAHLLPHQCRVDGGGQLKHLREQQQAGRQAEQALIMSMSMSTWGS